jgi:hypothetical protein
MNVLVLEGKFKCACHDTGEGRNFTSTTLLEFALYFSELKSFSLKLSRNYQMPPVGANLVFARRENGDFVGCTGTARRAPTLHTQLRDKPSLPL